jgi:hypothetical protein
MKKNFKKKALSEPTKVFLKALKTLDALNAECTVLNY